MDFVRITAQFFGTLAPRWARGQQPAPGRPEIESGDLGGWASPARIIRAHHHLCLQGSHFRAGRGFLWRAAGLPVVWEATPPAGTLRYQSDRTYGIDDGLQVLNTILQAKGVMLRRREDMLYLQPLAEMAKRDVPTFVGSLPDTVTDDEVVTLVLPLRIASANAAGGTASRFGGGIRVGLRTAPTKCFGDRRNRRPSSPSGRDGGFF